VAPKSPTARLIYGSRCGADARLGSGHHGLRIGVLRLPTTFSVPLATTIVFEPSSALTRPDRSLLAATSTLPLACIGPDASWSCRKDQVLPESCIEPVRLLKPVRPPRTPSREGDWMARTTSTLLSVPFSRLKVASAFESENSFSIDGPCS